MEKKQVRKGRGRKREGELQSSNHSHKIEDIF